MVRERDEELLVAHEPGRFAVARSLRDLGKRHAEASQVLDGLVHRFVHSSVDGLVPSSVHALVCPSRRHRRDPAARAATQPAPSRSPRRHAAPGLTQPAPSCAPRQVIPR